MREKKEERREGGEREERKREGGGREDVRGERRERKESEKGVAVVRGSPGVFGVGFLFSSASVSMATPPSFFGQRLKSSSRKKKKRIRSPTGNSPPPPPPRTSHISLQSQGQSFQTLSFMTGGVSIVLGHSSHYLIIEETFCIRVQRRPPGGTMLYLICVRRRTEHLFMLANYSRWVAALTAGLAELGAVSVEVGPHRSPAHGEDQLRRNASDRADLHAACNRRAAFRAGAGRRKAVREGQVIQTEAQGGEARVASMRELGKTRLSQRPLQLWSLGLGGRPINSVRYTEHVEEKNPGPREASSALRVRPGIEPHPP
ncbi:hypothetical protein WMY93_012758 [Mugilogobius chulae]|uniref:Uncharacterized protein n=1 Tax=Mugilogobius chulae TaxID=88201 RepID=A0AAW0P870_9GOBI